MNCAPSKKPSASPAMRALMAAQILLLSTPVWSQGESFECLIEPHVVADVGAQVEGIIDELPVDRGDFVSKGDVLATLEASVEKANVDLARARATMTADVDAAKVRERFGWRKFERMQEMKKEGQYVSDFEVDEANTERALSELAREQADEEMQLAKLELARAERVLSLRTVRSPVDGVVVERYLGPNERVEQEPILRVAQINPLNVEVIMPASMIGRITPGMAGLIRPEVGPQAGYQARVTVVDNVVNAASGMFGVRLELANPDLEISAGLKCEVRFMPGDAAAAATETPTP
jgi:RND family efflux transporter MFP subunit